MIKKKKLLTRISIVLLITLVCGNYSCQQNQEPKPNKERIQNKLTIEDAKSIYERRIEQEKSSKNGNRRAHKETPVWKDASSAKFTTGDDAFVISLLEDMDYLSLRTVGNSTAKNFEAAFTPVKLVIYKDSDGKEHIERMYIKADPEYAKSKNYNIEESDYTGMLWFEDYDDNFLRGFVYEKGKLIKSFTPSANADRRNLRTQACDFESSLTVVMTVYSITISNGIVYGPTQIDSYTFFVDYIDWESCTVSTTNTGQPNGSGWLIGSANLPSNDPNFVLWFGSLNSLEKQWILDNPGKAYKAYTNFYMAEIYSRGFYGGATNHDEDGTNQNAFKHALSAAFHTASWGPNVALTIMNNHEGGPNVPGMSSQMDYWNNALGISTANNCECTGWELIESIKSKINSGLGRRITGTGIPNNVLSPTTSANLDND